MTKEQILEAARQQVEEEFNEHRPQALKAARWAARHYRRPLSETLDHAEFALALLICGDDCGHDPDQLSLGQWLCVKACYHLREVYTKGKHPHCPDIRESRAFRRERSATSQIRDWESGKKPSPPALGTKPAWFQQILQEVNEEGASLLQIIMEAPADLWKEIKPDRGRTPRIKQRRLAAYLVDVLDWPVYKVYKAFHEVQGCVR